MKKTKLLMPLALALLLTSMIAASASASKVPTFTLSSQSTQLQFNLPAGTVFNGSISTTGTFRFWVNAPSGAQIINLGLIDNTKAFGFVAPQDGNYTFNFENDLPTPVEIEFSYVTNPDISGGNNSAGLSPVYLVIPIAIAILGSFLIFYFVRRRNKS
jgi:hypothetical protein